jgi:hypothetical protein
MHIQNSLMHGIEFGCKYTAKTVQPLGKHWALLDEGTIS